MYKIECLVIIVSLIDEKKKIYNFIIRNFKFIVNDGFIYEDLGIIGIIVIRL